MAYVNPAELIYVILASDSSLVTGITSGGTFHLFGPPGLPKTFSPKKAIVYYAQPGGEGDEHLPKRTKTYQFRCYGVTPSDATAVFHLLYNALHRRTHERVTLSNGTAIFQYARMVSDPADMVEPITEWNFVMGEFEIQFIEHTVL